MTGVVLEAGVVVEELAGGPWLVVVVALVVPSPAAGDAGVALEAGAWFAWEVVPGFCEETPPKASTKRRRETEPNLALIPLQVRGGCTLIAGGS